MRFIVDARYIRRRASGIRSYVEALVERMPAAASDQNFHLWAHPEAPTPIVQFQNVTQEIIYAPANGLQTLLMPTQLGSIDDGDVFHCTFNVMGRGIPCATVATIHDIRWIERPDICEQNPFLRQIRAPYFASGIKHAIRHANRVLTVSKAAADTILKFEPKALDRIRVTPCGCEPEFRPPTSRSSAAERAAVIIGQTNPYFLCVGVHAVCKGHDIALRAFAEASNPDERLVIVNRIDGSPMIQTLANELGISDKVVRLAGLSREDLVALMHGAQALLQPSRYEGFGIPALEAMSAGCPVISSDIEALAEVLGGAGIITPVEDVAALARAIRRVSNEAGLREDLRQHGLERAKVFSWDNTTRLTLEAYHEAAEEGFRGT